MDARTQPRTYPYAHIIFFPLSRSLSLSLDLTRPLDLSLTHTHTHSHARIGATVIAASLFNILWMIMAFES